MNFLITGHSEFAIGMQSALTMIAGEIEDVMFIPFLANETTEEYRQKIESSIEMYEHVVCFTDLLGGTSFKKCIEFSMTKTSFCYKWYKHSDVIGRIDDAEFWY